MSIPQLTVGEVQIWALLDARFALPPARMFGQVAAESWAPYKELYPWTFDADGMLLTNATSYLLRSRGRTILVDLGLGPGPHQNMGGARGALLDQLAEAGVTAHDIDTVALTHLHGDHIGWAMTQQGETAVPTFPRARVLLGQADWAFFSDPAHPQNAALQTTVAPLHGKGMVELVSGERAITDEITMLPTPGHTPGHCSLLVRPNYRSQGQGCLLTGDVLHSPAQITETDWSPGFDNNPTLSAETRWKLVQRADVESLLLVANHFPFPGFGRIVRLNGRRGFQALALSE